LRVRTEGEEWTRDQLERLLVARLRPGAVGSFLLASQRRANRVRAARPELARREASWAAVGAAAWLALASMDVDPFRRRARSGLLGWAVTVIMLDWHLGMVETEDGRPRNLGPADAATLLRAWLVPAVAARPAPALCLLGYATDAVDGHLARASEPTRFGRDLEGVVDSAFAVAVLRGGRRYGWLGRLAVLGEGVRLGVGLGYALVVYFGRAEAPDPRVLRASRCVAPLRAAGIILAAAGRSRVGGPLLGLGSAASVAAVVHTVIARRSEPADSLRSGAKPDENAVASAARHRAGARVGRRWAAADRTDPRVSTE